MLASRRKLAALAFGKTEELALLAPDVLAFAPPRENHRVPSELSAKIIIGDCNSPTHDVGMDLTVKY